MIAKDMDNSLSLEQQQQQQQHSFIPRNQLNSAYKPELIIVPFFLPFLC